MRQSAITQYKMCPYKYKLQYVDKLKTIPVYEANDALIVGTAIHYGCETGSVEKALENYYSNFNVIDDLQINEAMKLEYLLPQVLDFIKQFDKVEHEVPFQIGTFHGTADLLVHNEDGTVDLYDFKYSNNIDNYMESPQLHIYKYFLEQKGYQVNRMAFIFIPKTFIRQKNTEDLYQFRKRLKETLKDMEIEIKYLEYDQNKVTDSLITVVEMLETKEFPKNVSELCHWCEYEKYCIKGEDWMLLPKNERRNIEKIEKKVMWWYGAPFTGKTFLANKFPDPLMLNTDGNIKFVDAPYLSIKDTVKTEGRLTNRTLAWENFKDIIEELEKKQNDFKTIVVDLLEDCHEHCRIWIYDTHGIEHESDNSFKYYDLVRTEFLSTLKRLMNLDYENIILISHEDTTKDITKRTGDKITRISPNMQEKLANKIAGMVDVVARVVVEDGQRYMSFKTSDVEFGGGRLGIKSDRISLEYEELMKVYETANKNLQKKNEKKEKEVQAPEEKSKRTRKSKDDSNESSNQTNTEQGEEEKNITELMKENDEKAGLIPEGESSEEEEQPKRRRRRK